MSKISVFQSRALVFFLSGAFILTTFPVASFAQAGSGGTGALVGHIYTEDMRTPVRNAVVKLRNVATQKEYESEPTNLEGLYRINGIEEGRYILGVVSSGGSYNFQYSIQIKPNALAKLSLATKPGAAAVRIDQGTNRYEKKSVWDFFSSPAGILMLVVAAETALFVIALSQGEASPIR